MLLRVLVALLSLVGVLTVTPAFADPGGPSSTVDASERAFKKKKEKDDMSEEEKDAEQAEAEAKAERERKAKLARVVVLKWEGTKSADWQDETVRRNVRSRIDRPEAMFFPEVDLYQNGRTVKDRTVIPVMQPAIVPDTNVPRVMAAIDSVSAIPWNGLQPFEWRQKADELRALAEDLWFIDRVELREPMFLLYAQIGRAAENANDSSPPYYEQVGPFSVNYYYYLAATLAYQEPALMSKLTDQDLSGSVGIMLQQIQQGSFPTIPLDFEQEGVDFDPEWFNDQYEVRLNGIPVEPDSRGQMDVFLGRTDIYLVRKDTGHGLSERLEVSKLDDKNYFVRDVARKKMGKEFIDQLFLHKNECNPEVDGDILNFLAIYAKLHDQAEIYIAVPETGNPNKMWIWRYVRESGQLKLVGGGPDGFPVRFAAVFSTGLLYNNGSMAVDKDFSDEESLAPDDVANDRRVNVDLSPATIPFNFELRGHYNRLMVNIGAEAGFEAGEGQGWLEYYQTPGEPTTITVDPEASGCDTVELDSDGDGNPDLDENGDPILVRECGQIATVLNQKTFNRHLYMGAGVVLLRDAGIGFGPRFAFRVGWTNLPHAIVTTGHFGWAIQPGFLPAGERVRPLLDIDGRGGAAFLVKKSLGKDNGKQTVQGVFGLTLGIGMTF
ncbi:MAG: hypothetical protein H6742_00110 [Alphaproteobacteria bacterium]|nr:hypothetical protein [Alphaproteobacteria bacterium]